MFSRATSKGEAQVDFTNHPAEFHGYRRRRFADDHLDRLEERRTGAQGVGDECDGVGELLVEGVESRCAAAPQPHTWQEEADDRPDYQSDSGTEGRQNQAQEQEQKRDADDRAAPDDHVLTRPKLEIRPGNVSGQVRPEVPLLHDTVQPGECNALSHSVAQTTAGVVAVVVVSVLPAA
jgi:hypothetical protein